MGFRFRRSVRVLPGVRLNFSKSGISTSIGGHGATLNIGKRGTRATVGLPGTGLSYSTSLSGGAAPEPGEAAPSGSRSGLSVIAWVVAVLLGLFAIGHCSMQSPVGTAAQQPPTPAPSSSPADLRQVEAGSLNCRAAPDRSAATMHTFRRGETVTVTAEQNGWAQLEAGCWAAARYLGTGTGAARQADNPGSSAKAAGSCPCGGGDACTGPRGGRYCVTPSGKKHYGI